MVFYNERKEIKLHEGNSYTELGNSPLRLHFFLRFDIEIYEYTQITYNRLIIALLY